MADQALLDTRAAVARRRFQIARVSAVWTAVGAILGVGNLVLFHIAALGIIGLVVSASALLLLRTRPDLPPIPEAPAVEEREYPADSNGFRTMDWCSCGSTANAAPVVVTVDDEEQTIGWLCPDCRGDRRSPAAPDADPFALTPTPFVATHRAPTPRPAAPARLDDLRHALAALMQQMSEETASWGDDGDGAFVLDPEQHERYVRLVHDANALRDVIVAEEKAVEEHKAALAEANRPTGGEDTAHHYRSLDGNYEFRIPDPERFWRCGAWHEWTSIHTMETPVAVRTFCEKCDGSYKNVAPGWGKAYVEPYFETAAEEAHYYAARTIGRARLIPGDDPPEIRED